MPSSNSAISPWIGWKYIHFHDDYNKHFTIPVCGWVIFSVGSVSVCLSVCSSCNFWIPEDGNLTSSVALSVALSEYLYYNEARQLLKISTLKDQGHLKVKVKVTQCECVIKERSPVSVEKSHKKYDHQMQLYSITSNNPQFYFVHRHLSNAWYIKAHSVIGK